MWYVVIACALSAAPPTVEVRTVEGETAAGTLVGLEGQRVAIQSDSGRREWELSRVAGLSIQGHAGRALPAPARLVELADGSRLAAADFAADKGRAQVSLVGAPAVELPVQEIRLVRLAPPTDALASQWEQIVGAESPADVLVVKRDDAIDYYKGVIHRVTEEAVDFETDGERLPVKRSKVFGLVYHRTSGRELPEAMGTVVESSGSVWAASSVALAGGQLEWVTPLGLKVARPLGALVRLDLSRGKFVYLSDLPPESTEWVPYFSMGKELPARVSLFAPRQDQGLQSGPLQLDGKRYAKGLSIHSRTTIVYRLPERFRRFSAVAGIDDQVRPQGSVRLVIRGDERVLFETMVSGREAARPVELDVSGVRRLVILVDFGEDLDVGDHLNLCDARLLK